MKIEDKLKILNLPPDNSVVFSLTAIIDLIGFTSHLELSYRNLNSDVGNQIVERINNIEKAVDFFQKELEQHPEYYFQGISFLRINDSLILTMDVDNLFKPNPGQISKLYYNQHDTDVIMKEIDFNDNRNLNREQRINEFLGKRVHSVAKFLGLVSRIHRHINTEELAYSLPGCKTVVSSGFRKRIFNSNGKEDCFSANFSFSNAYIAEQSLKGHNFFVESAIFSILCRNAMYDPILKHSIMFEPTNHFDLLERLNIKEDAPKSIVGKKHIIKLFRQEYLFQELDPSTLTYLQMIEHLIPYFKGEIVITNTTDLYECLKSTNEKNHLRINPIDIDQNIHGKTQYVIFGFRR